MAKTINIKFPFKDSDKGFFLDLTTDDISAIKSDLMHLLLTSKGERYYMPDFGTNLRNFIFQPHDDITHSQIHEEINDAVSKFIPNLVVSKLTVNYNDNDAYVAEVRADFVIQEGVFEKRDFVIIKL